MHRDVFLRELISNANDALEKLRLSSLIEPDVLTGAEQMNITIKAIKDEEGAGRLIITGMCLTTCAICLAFTRFVRHWHWDDAG